MMGICETGLGAGVDTGIDAVTAGEGDAVAVGAGVAATMAEVAAGLIAGAGSEGSGNFRVARISVDCDA